MNARVACVTPIILLSLLMPALAHDLIVPPWRGECKTTFQEWRFDDDDDPAAPEVIVNPYGPATVDIAVGPLGSGWSFELGGFGSQTGLWDLGGVDGEMLVKIKDCSGPVALREVWVQITCWEDISQPPSVDVRGATLQSSQSLIVESVPTGGRWVLHQGIWSMVSGAQEDEIVVTANWQWGSVVDEIVVDTRSLLETPICPDPFADSDGDGDVDQADFARVQLCITEPGECLPAGCECFDRPESGSAAGDGDIDADDVDAFEKCASGPGIAADVACDGGN